MNIFSVASKERLATCHPDLQRLFDDVIKYQDCAILVGHRCKDDQDVACQRGLSHTPWPTSKHNAEPSRAVDVAPYPIDWADIRRFQDFAELVKMRADILGIAINYGGDFTTIKDYDHFELA